MDRIPPIESFSEEFKNNSYAFIPLTDPKNEKAISCILEKLEKLGVYNRKRMIVPSAPEDFTEERAPGIFAYRNGNTWGIFFTREQPNVGNQLAHLPNGVCGNLQDSMYIGIYGDSTEAYFAISNGFFYSKPCNIEEMSPDESSFVQELLILVNNGKYSIDEID